MSPSEQRNVILVVLDSARADLWRENSPNFAALTGSGARFERAIAPAGWTLPSHVSMFTGLDPSEHGVVALGGPGGTEENRRHARRRMAELEKDGSLLASRLRSSGFRTFATSATPWVGRATGLDRGFAQSDYFYFLDIAPPGRIQKRLPKRARQVYESFRSTADYARWLRARRDKGAERVLGSLKSFVRGSGPFFAFTNLIETHEPHFPPGPDVIGSLAGRQNLGAVANLVLQPPLMRLLRLRAHNWGTASLPRKLLARWRAAYAAEMRYLDRWLIRLMETLDEAKVLDETVVILTADHGEVFDEGGRVGHGLSLREGAANVPLGIWGPGIGAEVVRDPASITKLAATIESIALGTEHPDSLLTAGARGRAVMEIEHPHAVSRPPRRARRVASGPGAAFYDGDLKLVVDPFSGRSLFDLSSDPTEQIDLLGERSPSDAQGQMFERWKSRVTSATAQPSR